MKLRAENTAWKPTRRSILLAAVPLLLGVVPLMAAIEEDSMAQSDRDFGKLNLKAPVELSRFAFDNSSTTYAFKEPVAGHAYTRATYTSHCKTTSLGEEFRGRSSDVVRGIVLARSQFHRTLRLLFGLPPVASFRPRCIPGPAVRCGTATRRLFHDSASEKLGTEGASTIL
jgi:hypothetical protein